MIRDALPSPFRVEGIRFTLHQHSSQNCPKSEVRRDQLMSIRVVCSWSFVPCCFCKIDLTSNLPRFKDKAPKRAQAFMSASFMREAPTASSYFSHTITSGQMNLGTLEDLFVGLLCDSTKVWMTWRLRGCVSTIPESPPKKSMVAEVSFHESLI